MEADEIRDHRCPSCEHKWKYHQPEGCWFGVTVGTLDKDVTCVCSMPHPALTAPEATT